jgi:ABC-type lipoprotein export system ATPase subunit
MFKRLNRQERTVIIVTHDPEVAAVPRRHLEIRDGIVKELRS